MRSPTRGCLVVPTGGVNTLGRLEMARMSRATVVCCTPSYALHLAEVGAENKLDVGSLGVRRLILAGEPGGSVPAVREPNRIALARQGARSLRGDRSRPLGIWRSRPASSST